MNLWGKLRSDPKLRGQVKVLVLLSIVITFVLVYCQHEPVAPVLVPGLPGPVPVDPCDPDTVYFQQTILPLIVSSCAIPGCHDAVTHEGDMDLTSYGNIMGAGIVDQGDPGNSKIVDVITHPDLEEVMPPPPNEPLTADQIGAIELWIEQGARNNACVGACDTSNVSYAGTVAPLLGLKCNGCHSGGTPQGGLDLTSYPVVFMIALDGRLAGAVQHLGGYQPMPPSGGIMPQCEIDEILIWIGNGAPND